MESSEAILMPADANATDLLSEKCVERTSTPIQRVQACPIDLLFESDEEMTFLMHDDPYDAAVSFIDCCEM